MEVAMILSDLASRLSLSDAAKLTNVKIARFRECRDLVRECDQHSKNNHTKPSTTKLTGYRRGRRQPTCPCRSRLVRGLRSLEQRTLPSLSTLWPPGLDRASPTDRSRSVSRRDFSSWRTSRSPAARKALTTNGIAVNANRNKGTHEHRALIS